MYSICVGTLPGNDLPQGLLYPPGLAFTETFINVEDVAALLFGRDAPYIAHILQENFFSNAAGRRIITNPKLEVRDMVEDAVGANHESDSHSNTNNEEGLKDNDEEEDEQGEAELVY